MIDDAIEAERGEFILGADERLVLDAAVAVYRQRWPSAWHLKKRRGYGWIDVGERVRLPNNAQVTRMFATEWTFRCKFCGKDLATTSDERGESRLPAPFVKKLDRHVLRCAVAVVLDEAMPIADTPRIKVMGPPRRRR